MTNRQRDYLRAIDSVAARLGYSPTIREVAEEVGSAYNAALSAVVSLERQGLIARGYATGRSMRLTDAGRSALEEGQAA